MERCLLITLLLLKVACLALLVVLNLQQLDHFLVVKLRLRLQVDCLEINNQRHLRLQEDLWQELLLNKNLGVRYLEVLQLKLQSWIIKDLR